jgi:hypothetical protein
MALEALTGRAPSTSQAHRTRHRARAREARELGVARTPAAAPNPWLVGIIFVLGVGPDPRLPDVEVRARTAPHGLVRTKAPDPFWFRRHDECDDSPPSAVGTDDADDA